MIKATAPKLKRLIRIAIGPMLKSDFVRGLRARQAARITHLEAVTSSSQLLHTGNLSLAAGDHLAAIKFYCRACSLSPETRWVSGQSLLDYVKAHSRLFNRDLTLLTEIVNDEEYNVPDLELILFKVALKDNGDELAELVQKLPLSRLNYDVLIQIGSEALAIGRNSIAIIAYSRAVQLRPDDIGLRQQLGVTEFLSRDYKACEETFASVDHIKEFEKMRWGVSDSPYRILDRTWIPAIGHIAFLDTYVKSVQLGWLREKKSLLVYDETQPPAGWPLFKFFSKHIEIVPTHIQVERKINEVVFGKKGEALPESSLDYRRAALSHPFWYGPDGDGAIRWYGPLGAAVEAAWKAEKREALYALTGEERKIFRKRLQQVYGVPEDAWFVLLHVREPGFHSGWHKYHAGTRNAHISTYDAIIDFVIAQGGWVVRGGDPSMTSLAPRDKVVDYATNSRRSPEMDIYLCAECKYFVGTNSGFSVVPPMFGKRCVLTNWSPIGIPNWYLDDVYIPKLVRKVSEDRYLTYSEMYDSFAGWSQFARDFDSATFSIEDNTPEDLLDVVEEVHHEIFGTGPAPDAEDQHRLQAFNEISLARGGYVGSRMSYRFLKKYPQLLEIKQAPQ
jgi:putative glycosyltransferase (TIGR04372 family)